MLGDLVVGDGLLELGAGKAVADGASEVAEIEALGAGFGRTEKALESAAKVLGAEEEGFGVGGTRLDETYGWARGERGEEVFVARGIKIQPAVEF